MKKFIHKQMIIIRNNPINKNINLVNNYKIMLTLIKLWQREKEKFCGVCYKVYKHSMMDDVIIVEGMPTQTVNVVCFYKNQQKICISFIFFKSWYVICVSLCCVFVFNFVFCFCMFYFFSCMYFYVIFLYFIMRFISISCAYSQLHINT